MVQYQQAAQTALELGDRSAWYEYTVWAAVCALRNEDYMRGLNLLIRARSDEPEDAPKYERWVARTWALWIPLDTRPELGRLRGLLEDLRTQAEQLRAPAADMPVGDGELHRERGEWAEALRCCENAWNIHDGRGVGKYFIATRAIDSCLRLGQWTSAADWIAALAAAGLEDRPGLREEHELHLTLATGKEAGELVRRLRHYADRVYGVTGPFAADRLREATVRVTMLVLDEGDPAAAHHPARQEMRRRWRRTQSVRGTYNARLLLLDYRLACLRHAAAVPPVDDLYYATPQQVPPSVAPADVDDFAHRLHQASAAAGWAMQYARYLDGLLECDWRQREVQSRIERISEIQNAAGA